MPPSPPQNEGASGPDMQNDFSFAEFLRTKPPKSPELDSDELDSDELNSDYTPRTPTSKAAASNFLPPNTATNKIPWRLTSSIVDSPKSQLHTRTRQSKISYARTVRDMEATKERVELFQKYFQELDSALSRIPPLGSAVQEYETLRPQQQGRFDDFELQIEAMKYKCEKILEERNRWEAQLNEYKERAQNREEYFIQRLSEARKRQEAQLNEYEKEAQNREEYFTQRLSEAKKEQEAQLNKYQKETQERREDFVKELIQERKIAEQKVHVLEKVYKEQKKRQIEQEWGREQQQQQIQAKLWELEQRTKEQERKLVLQKSRREEQERLVKRLLKQRSTLRQLLKVQLQERSGIDTHEHSTPSSKVGVNSLLTVDITSRPRNQVDSSPGKDAAEIVRAQPHKSFKKMATVSSLNFDTEGDPDESYSDTSDTNDDWLLENPELLKLRPYLQFLCVSLVSSIRIQVLEEILVHGKRGAGYTSHGAPSASTSSESTSGFQLFVTGSSATSSSGAKKRSLTGRDGSDGEDNEGDAPKRRNVYNHGQVNVTLHDFFACPFYRYDSIKHESRCSQPNLISVHRVKYVNFYK
jgi:hypothetical protein